MDANPGPIASLGRPGGVAGDVAVDVNKIGKRTQAFNGERLVHCAAFCMGAFCTERVQLDQVPCAVGEKLGIVMQVPRRKKKLREPSRA